MSDNENRKVIWSIRVRSGLKKYFEDRATDRCTDPQEDVRQILADFREREINKNSKEDQ